MNALGSTSTIPMPVMTSTESLRANGLERKTGSWYLLKHNWRQLFSLVPGTILLCATGNLHTSWTIWQLLTYIFNYEHMDASILVVWFIGVIFGSMVGALLNSNWSKICIYYTVAVALLPVSIIFVLYQMSSYHLLLIGRSLAGTLYGVILITFILHIADNSSQFMRRYFIWTISIITIMPTVLIAELVSNVTSIHDTIASSGVIMFVLAIVTLILMPCTNESIIFLLQSGNDLRALEILLKLRNESRHFIRRDFNEFKMMLAEDCNDDGGKCNIFSNGNSRPLYVLCLLRLLNVFVSGSAVYWISLVLIWFDYRQWALLRPMHIAAQMLTVSDSVLVTEMPFNLTDSDHANNNTKTISSFQTDSGFGDSNLALDHSDMLMQNINDSIALSQTLLVNDTENVNMTWPFNQTDESLIGNSDLSGLLDATNDISPSASSSFAQHLFIHTAYSHRLPSLKIAELLVAIFLIKIILGIPLMCLAEKYQIYRNRILFKISFCVGALNVIFLLGTMLCYRIDDSSLLFTFYMAKLMNLVYGTYLLITFSIDTIGYSELAESFSLTKRYGSIACITIVEQLLHIIVLLLIMNAQFEFYYFVIQSMVVCLFCHLLVKSLPNEYLNCSLRIARDKYFVKMASANH